MLFYIFIVATITIQTWLSIGETKTMATINSITEKLQSRAPFLSVARFKSGFSIVIKDHPFLLVECQKFLGTKIGDLTDADVENAVNQAVPTVELINQYKEQLNSVKTTATADIHKAYVNQSWDEVGNLAFSLVGVEEQLKILETAYDFIANK